MGQRDRTVKKQAFLHIAGQLNQTLHIVPLLFGSLGLEQRLHRDLHAQDVDVLIPEAFLSEKWETLVSVMDRLSYALYDLHEHAFQKDGLIVAFASLESLAPFAGVDPKRIPVVEEAGVRYRLLTLQDDLKVYTASSKDGYRKQKKHGADERKIALIRSALEQASHS